MAARLLAIVVAVAILAPTAAVARLLCECRMMGTTVAAHACCKAKKQAKRSHAPAVRGAPCCKMQWEAIDDGAVALEPKITDADVPLASADLLTELDLQSLAAPGVALLAERARGPPFKGPPLYIRHLALLN